MLAVLLTGRKQNCLVVSSSCWNISLGLELFPWLHRPTWRFCEKWTPARAPWGTKLSFPGSRVGFRIMGDQNTLILSPFWNISSVSTWPDFTLRCNYTAEGALGVCCLLGAVRGLPEAGVQETGKLSLFTGSKSTRTSLWPFTRKRGDCLLPCRHQQVFASVLWRSDQLVK